MSASPRLCPEGRSATLTSDPRLVRVQFECVNMYLTRNISLSDGDTIVLLFHKGNLCPISVVVLGISSLITLPR